MKGAIWREELVEVCGSLGRAILLGKGSSGEKASYFFVEGLSLLKPPLWMTSSWVPLYIFEDISSKITVTLNYPIIYLLLNSLTKKPTLRQYPHQRTTLLEEFLRWWDKWEIIFEERGYLGREAHPGWRFFERRDMFGKGPSGNVIWRSLLAESHLHRGILPRRSLYSQRAPLYATTKNCPIFILMSPAPRKARSSKITTTKATALEQFCGGDKREMMIWAPFSKSPQVQFSPQLKIAQFLSEKPPNERIQLIHSPARLYNLFPARAVNSI